MTVERVAILLLGMLLAVIVIRERSMQEAACERDGGEFIVDRWHQGHCVATVQRAPSPPPYPGPHVPFSNQ